MHACVMNASCMCACMYACMYVCMYACMYVFMHACMHVGTVCKCTHAQTQALTHTACTRALCDSTAPPLPPPARARTRTRAHRAHLQPAAAATHHTQMHTLTPKCSDTHRQTDRQTKQTDRERQPHKLSHTHIRTRTHHIHVHVQTHTHTYLRTLSETLTCCRLTQRKTQGKGGRARP
jgi:hypothetical protein